MAGTDYFELIEQTFENVENSLEVLADDLDIQVAEGVINVTFSNGVIFVFSRQPPTEQLWLATPGGGFHFTWQELVSDWIDTKSGANFRDFLIGQIWEHVGLNFSWGE
mgnify:CR=1 FL=1